RVRTPARWAPATRPARGSAPRFRPRARGAGRLLSLCRASLGLLWVGGSGFLTTLGKCLVRSLVVPGPSAFEIAVCSDISQLARGFQEGAVRCERESASDRDTADARVGQLCDWR